MKKIYNIEVDCANCANLIEEKINKMDGVKANISFLTQKMELEFDDGQEEKKLIKSILKECRKIEPDFEIEG